MEIIPMFFPSRLIFSVFLPSWFFYNSFLPKCLFLFGPLFHTFNLNTSLLLHGPPMICFFFFLLKILSFSHAEKPLETWPPLLFSKHHFFPPLVFQKSASFPMQSTGSHVVLHFSPSQSSLFSMPLHSFHNFWCSLIRLPLEFSRLWWV